MDVVGEAADGRGAVDLARRVFRNVVLALPSPVADAVTDSARIRHRRARLAPVPWAHVLLDLLFPRRCVVCSLPGATLCARCAVSLPRLEGPICARCGAPVAWPVARCRECAGRRLAFASARAGVEYDEAVRALVSAWKERGLRGLAPLAASVVAEVVPPPSAQLIAFVPPDGDRSLRRGHHPPERLARELGRLWGLPVVPLLRRTRPLRSQRGLQREARRRNVRGAFRADGARGSVLLVDDVYTTGSTVGAAASALRAAGAGSVEVVTFARAVRG
jgi:predicted amidophosphoribosyltransferase